jgi:hypothetical protein
MSTIPAFQSGLSSLQSGLQQLNQNAADIASLGQSDSDVNLTSTLVSNLSAKQQVEAAVKIIEASNATVGTLLDIEV